MPQTNTAKPEETGKTATQTPPTQPPPQAAPPKMTPEEATMERARRGDKTVLPELEKLLDKQPQIWEATGDLTRLTEQVWIGKVSDQNLLHRDCLRRTVEKMRKDLAEATSNALDRVLIDRIICCWLAVQHAEIIDATSQTESVQVSLLQMRRLESANRRFIQATKALAQVRRLTAGIKIEITHHSEPTPREAVKDVVAERMREENLVAAAS